MTKEVTVRGVTYSSFSAACKANSIYPRSKSSKKFLNKGLSHAEAIEKILSNREQQQCVFRGKTFNSLNEACTHHGISNSTNIRKTAKKLNISFQEAMEKSIKRREAKPFKSQIVRKTPSIRVKNKTLIVKKALSKYDKLIRTRMEKYNDCEKV